MTPPAVAPPRPTKPPRRSPLNGLEVKEWMRFTKSWFICNPRPRKRDQREHPAKFPEAMAEEFIRFFTKPGEVVLDPFAGVGSTLAAAVELDRQGLGIEICERFREIGQEALEGADARLLLGDARNAVDLCRGLGCESVEYVLTSPPYWDMLRQSRGNVDSAQKARKSAGLRTAYTDLTEDLGNEADYDRFLDDLAGILGDLRGLLAPKRYLTVVIQNVRVPGGEVRPLAWDLTARLREFYTFKGERIWLQDNKRLGCWGWPSELVTNVHHHYCLNFKNDRA